MNTIETIADRIRIARQAKGYSQQYCAERLLIPRQNWGAWETGKVIPGSQNLIEICKILEVSADWLLGIHE